MPVDKGLDHTFNLLTEGYDFIQKRCKQFGTEVFETRLMGKKMICMTGRDAVELFYDTERFQRAGAVPKRIQKTLFGEGGIQTMDGDKHTTRKLMFLSLMTEKELNRLRFLTKQQWQIQTALWSNQQEVILFDKAEDIMCRIACLWAGVPLKESEVSRRAHDFGAMIDAIGGVGPRYQEGRKARLRTEEWIQSVIEKFRSGALNENKGNAIQTIATHRDENGELLDVQMAAVELINVLRPIVAVARFVTFGVLAINQFPQVKDKLKNAEERYWDIFVQEVRRYYPFAPFLGAMVRRDFEWKGYSFQKGASVLIDLYGTNHDPTLWDQPEDFRPERFDERKPDLFDFVPQGGGDPLKGHRCPGEEVTVIIMKASLQFLVDELKYVLTDGQNLTVNHVRLPTLPESRIVIRKVEG